MSTCTNRSYKSYHNRMNFISCLVIISFLSMVCWGIVRTVYAVKFDMNCEQYIKRAADASSVEIAKEELEKALNYCENNGLTEGFVSIFFKQPKNDIGFWYKNLKMAHEELNSLLEKTSTLEETNLLMKVRESLIDADEDGIDVTVPDGISIYPYNQLYFFWGFVSLIVFIFSAIYVESH